MKKLVVVAMLGIASLFYNSAKAQISLNINIGSQPLWARLVTTMLIITIYQM